MLFYQFNNITQKKANSSSFIKQTTVWSHKSLTIKFCMCYYEVAHFTPDLFEHYRVALPQEIARSVKKRQAEFLAGRVAAYEALAHIGAVYTDINISIAKHRAPRWPAGVIGSISHTSNIAIAIVCDCDENSALGIDLEDNMEDEVCAQLAKQIHNDDEAHVLTSLGLSSSRSTTLIFSAKESLFKALYKYVNDYFGFECARVVYADLNEGILQLELEHTFRAKYHLDPIYQCDFQLFDLNILTLVKIVN